LINLHPPHNRRSEATAPLSPTLRAPRATKRLQQCQHRRAGAAIRAADQWPAHYVAVDLLRVGTDLTTQPYRARRAALETLLTDHQLQAPWTLCPSTTDPQQATEWPAWSSVGLEGLVFKRLDQG
jgi:ATP-dependent DNA ligase